MKLPFFLAAATALVFTASTANAQSACCATKKTDAKAQHHSGDNVKKEAKVMKEMKDGAEAVKVNVKTTVDGKTEEKTLEGQAARDYVATMDKECSGDCCEGHEGKEAKKVIKKEVEKKETKTLERR